MKTSSNGRARDVAVVLGAFLAWTSGPAVGAQSTAEDLARSQFELAQTRMRAGNHQAGLRDLDEILKNYPTTLVADDALLEQARYQLDIARDAVTARLLTERLRKEYNASDSVAMSYVLDGRGALMTGRSATDIALAIENFERLPIMFRGNAAVPESMYRAGAAARLGGNAAEAVRRFGDVVTRYPTSTWSQVALLDSALAIVRAGQPPARAMEQLQRVRNAFPGTAAAATALRWNTLLYRIYLRGASQPIYQPDDAVLGPTPARLQEVTDLEVTDTGDLLVATKAAIFAYPIGKTPVRQSGASEPRAVRFDRDGRPVTVLETGLLDSQGKAVALEMPREGVNPMRLKIADAVLTSTGEYLLADRDRQAIYRFTAAGAAAGEYASRLRADRMAIDDLDQVAVLSEKTVVLIARDGKRVGLIAERGPNHRLQDPADLAVDRFGHVYVLDRASVFVFAPTNGNLLATFALPERVQARAITVDAAGRLFVYDGRSSTIRAYR